MKNDEIMIFNVALLLCFLLLCFFIGILSFSAEDCQKIFWGGGFCHGSIGLQETTILFCPALPLRFQWIFLLFSNTMQGSKLQK